MSVFSSIKGWFKSTFGGAFGSILFYGLLLIIIIGAFLFFILSGSGYESCIKRCDREHMQDTAEYTRCIENCESLRP